MKSNLVKCLRCRKILIQEEYEDHVCTPVLKDTKTILIDYWWQSKTEKGEPQITAKGLDGFLYTLIQTKEKGFLKLNPSDDSLQGDKPDGDLTAP